MSLLLNALKKAEEGEKSPDGAAESVATDSPAAVNLAAPAAGESSSASAVDFDSIIDETVKQESAPPPPPPPPLEGAESKKRVDAARVFRARSAGGADDVAAGGGGFITKLIYSVLGLVVVGAGGYGVVIAGLIPGLDMRAVEGFLGLQEQSQQVVTTGGGAGSVGIGAQLQVAADVVLLPQPDVDVQSEVDFAALRLPENSRNTVGEEQYIKQIAFLTGFDINKEKTRSLEEQKQLLLDLEIERDAASSSEVEIEDLQAEEEIEEEVVVYTADLSRQIKLGLDSSTPSDGELRIDIQQGSNQPAVQVETQTAQVDVRASVEGTERLRLIARARALYNNGDYLEAEAVYRSVLVDSPANLNALRGVAQIALITGRYQSAIASYLDLLGYYPNDPVAVAELTNLRGGATSGSYYEIEKALKSSLGKIPAVDARLYFSLGNLYAQNGDWVKAQRAYFEAFSRETGNPDYVYNLAVVLDYLNKQQLAVRYYQEALRLAQDTPAGFNRAATEARIRDLNS